MVETKTVEEAAKNYQDAIGTVPGRYKAGVQRAKDVIEKAIAAESLYAERVQEAISKGTRAKALERVTTEQWRKRAADVGSTRIAGGMRAAADKQRAGITRVLDKLHEVELPPRVADSDANIDNRVKPVVRALKELKG